MIQLNDKYFIDFDTYNIILKEKKIAKSGKNKGKEKFEAVGYYINFEHLTDMLVKKCYLKDDDNDKITSLKEVIDRTKKLRDEILEQIKIVVKEGTEEENEEEEQ